MWNPKMPFPFEDIRNGYFFITVRMLSTCLFAIISNLNYVFDGKFQSERKKLLTFLGPSPNINLCGWLCCRLDV